MDETDRTDWEGEHAVTALAKWKRMAVVAAVMIAGCATPPAPRVDDPHLLQPGTPRAAVEAALGPARRHWRPNERVTYDLFQFHPPAPATPDFALVVELTGGPRQPAFPHSHYTHLWIGFDAADRVCGAFTEYAVLPEEPAPPNVPAPQGGR
jgi:hypothetical protein